MISETLAKHIELEEVLWESDTRSIANKVMDNIVSSIREFLKERMIDKGSEVTKLKLERVLLSKKGKENPERNGTDHVDHEIFHSSTLNCFGVIVLLAGGDLDELLECLLGKVDLRNKFVLRYHVIEQSKKNVGVDTI